MRLTSARPHKKLERPHLRRGVYNPKYINFKAISIACPKIAQSYHAQ